MASFSNAAKDLIQKFAKQAGKSADELQDIVTKGLNVNGKINKPDVEKFFKNNPLNANASVPSGASDASRARYMRANEIASDPNASQAARDRAANFLANGTGSSAIDSSGTGQKGHATRTTKEQWEAQQKQAKLSEAAERKSAAKEAAQRDRFQKGGGIYDRVYRGEDGKLHLSPQDFSIDSSGTGQKGRNHLTKEEWEIKKKQKEIDDKKALEDKVYKDIRAREARIDEVNALNRPMQKRTLGEKAREVIDGTGDESRRFAGRNTRQANMEKANADINAANQVYMDTGEGSAQRLHDKKSYWAEVKGKGKQTPPSDTKLGQGGTTAPNGTNPADIAEQNSSQVLNLDGIAEWAKENQLIVAGGLVAGTLLLTDD